MWNNTVYQKQPIHNCPSEPTIPWVIPPTNMLTSSPIQTVTQLLKQLQHTEMSSVAVVHHMHINNNLLFNASCVMMVDKK